MRCTLCDGAFARFSNRSSAIASRFGMNPSPTQPSLTGLALRKEGVAHRMRGRLVWTRDHSIENYFFEPSALVTTLRYFTRAPWFDQALDRFTEICGDILTIACAVALAGRKAGNLSKISSSVEWRSISLAGPAASLDLEVWRRALEQRGRLPLSRYESARYRIAFTTSSTVSISAGLTYICADNRTPLASFCARTRTRRVQSAS